MEASTSVAMRFSEPAPAPETPTPTVPPETAAVAASTAETMPCSLSASTVSAPSASTEEFFTTAETSAGAEPRLTSFQASGLPKSRSCSRTTSLRWSKRSGSSGSSTS